MTNSTAGVASRHDYMPFGEELFNGGRTFGMGYGTTDGIRQKFTSKERDNKTGLDYFLARYYSSTQGRFTSPDEFTGGPDELYYFAEDASTNPTFYAELGNPQSLNKYQYTYNNALRYTDPDGHCPTVVGKYLCTPAGQRAIERGGQRVIERSTPYVAVVVGALVGATEWARTGNTVADASCPGCTSSQRMGQALMEDTKPPNPNGQQGARDHQDEVKKQTDKAQAEAKPGESVEQGKRIRGVDSTRRPDVQVVGPDGKVVKVVEVERRPNSRRNRDREAEYDRLKVPNQTVPIPKCSN